MYDAFARLLNMSLMASVLVFALVVFRLVFKNASKRLICGLWILVACRLLCPMSIESGLSVFNLLPMKEVKNQKVYQFQYNGHSEKPIVSFKTPTFVEDEKATERISFAIKTSDFYLPTILFIWFAGMCGMLIIAIVGYIDLKRSIGASIKKKKNIYICDEVMSPFILGIFRPMIYLPSGMDIKVEKSVILHEEAHIKRHDHWWKPLGYVLLSIYWFNPAIWLAFILLCRDIEAACDEKVIREMNKESIADYSKALLFCAMQKRRITACPIAFGETNVKGRVRNVLKYKKPSFLIMIVATVVSVTMGISFLTDPVSINAFATQIVQSDTENSSIEGIDGVTDVIKYEENELETEKENPIISKKIKTETWKKRDCYRDGQLITVEVREYDANGNIIASEVHHSGGVPEGSRTIYSLDSDGRRISGTILYKDGNESNTVPYYFYDSVGNLIEIRWESSSGIQIEKYGYDDFGNVSDTIILNENEEIIAQSHIDNKYDQAERLISSCTVEEKHDVTGQSINQIIYTEYKYDKDGLLSQAILIDESGNELERYEYTY